MVSRSNGTARRITAGLLVSAMLFMSTAAFGATGPGSAAHGAGSAGPVSADPTSVLVRFRDAAPQPQVPGTAGPAAARVRAGVHERAGGRNARGLSPVPGLEVVQVPPGLSAEELIERYESDPAVLYAEPDVYFELAEVPDDTLFGQQWALDNAGQRGGTPGADIGILDAWDLTQGSESVIVAVIDTGVDYTHQDLAPRMWPGLGYDFYFGTNDPMDRQGHGTHIAGTIAAASGDGFGVAGVAPGVQIMALNVFDASGSRASASAIIEAIGYANHYGARIINASWGTTTLTSQMLSVRWAIETSPALFVCAAGNTGSDTATEPFYPASWSTVLDNVISVAATDRDDELASFSNRGTTVDLAAPGADIVSTVIGRETVAYHESFAEPGTWVAEFDRITPWGLSDAHFTSSPFALADSPDGGYANDEDSAARMRDPVSLAGVPAPVVRFEMLLDTEEDFFDGVRLEASTDRSTWHLLNSWSGTTGERFDSFSESLAPFEGASQFWLRFRFSSDETVTASGVYIDDLRITGNAGAGPSNRHGSKSGTSMATPHVTGVAALLKSRDYSLRAGEIAAVIKDTAEPVDSLEGLVATGARLDAAAAVAAVGEGPPPFIAIEGQNRFVTAVRASQEAYPDGLDAAGERTVVLATGRNWPDALGGAALAGALDGPLLLVDTNRVPLPVIEEIERLGAERAIVLGGESAVGEAVVASLEAGLGGGSVERIWGGSRYETADRIARRVVTERGAEWDGTAFVATGRTFADAVAAAPLAAANGWPLFLAHPSAGLRDATVETMRQTGVTEVLLLGGEMAVAPGVEQALVHEYGAERVTRLAGSSRYYTAAAIAAYGVVHAGLRWDRVGIATGQAFPDALSGGVLQGKAGSVMLLTPSGSLAAAAQERLEVHAGEIETVTYFGGESAVGSEVRFAVIRALGW